MSGNSLKINLLKKILENKIDSDKYFYHTFFLLSDLQIGFFKFFLKNCKFYIFSR